MARLTARLDEFREANRVPAVIGAVIDRDGAVDLAVSGTRRRDGDEAATVEDNWHIGSCAKAMTAALYGRLVDQGRAEWGVPVAHLLPDLAGDIDPGWDDPTIDDLLRCRAGVAPNPSRQEMRASWDDPPAPDDERTAATVSALRDPPRKPGRFTYSNLSYVVAGAIIDRLAERPFEQALQAEVCQPVGITTLGFGPPPKVCGHRAHLRLGPLTIGRARAVPPGDRLGDNPPILTPAGRMHLSIADWGRFLRVFLAEGDPLLAPATAGHLVEVPDHDADNPSPAGTMAMGWAPADGLGCWRGMQGSNTLWGATALIHADRRRAAMVVANDGRPRVIQRTALLAADLFR